MFKTIKALLSAAPAATDAGFSDLQIAAAALLVEAAAADGTFCADERAALGRRLTAYFDLEAAEVEALIVEAESHQQEADHLLRFTRSIKDSLEPEQRGELMEMLWAVVLADGVVDPFEDQLLRRLSGLIYVSDRERGAARKRAEAKLGR